ncbi:MAG: UbiD family decarboxylase [Dehalococcoidia bacterium]|nr:UbiD family decarboxylase [Dehalococcoidia bacterium]
MPFLDLQSFMQRLEAVGELHRVTTEVDPELEITEIATRSVREGRPALLFENVRGSQFPLVINTLASRKRIEIALGRPPDEIGEELVSFVERMNPPSLGKLWHGRKELMRLSNIRPRHIRSAPVQQVIEQSPDLLTMPALKCWPGDAGRFITLPLVHSRDPETGVGNLGIYRMQVFGAAEAGMHMQIQKGGGFHHWKAEKEGKPLEMAVALGGDPALILSAIMALPEGIDEMGFAGIVRGARTPLVKARTVDLRVPANAEFVLEGVVRPGVRRLEGPFGDHFGHYSGAAEFPVFEVKAITHRRNAVYPATVVGRPPQEDRFMGDATQMLLKPFIRLLRKEVKDLWAYYEAGFHNLLVVSVETRYAREPIKTALGLLGEGQLSLTKCMVLVGPDVDPGDFKAVLGAIRRNFDAPEDFQLIARTAIDTLDFTGEATHRGSKMVLDATGLNDAAKEQELTGIPVDLRTASPYISKQRLFAGALLAVQVSGQGQGRGVIETLIKHPGLSRIKIVVAVSEDVDIGDDEQLLWGIFTRFDPARDVVFTDVGFKGIAPVYRGVMGIDATWKQGYQAPLQMDPDIIRKVDQRWAEYWK